MVFFIAGMSMVRYVRIRNPAAHNAYQSNCASIDPMGQQRCWQQDLRRILQNRGIDEAMKKVAQMYAANPDFGSYCHEFMHLVGDAAYSQTRKTYHFAVPTNTSYCSFGFYHGFVEAMLRDGFDKNKAKTLCDSVGKQLLRRGISAVGSCYHGLGHGFAESVTIYSDRDIPKVLARSLPICKEAISNDALTQNCYSGVFNVISNYYIEHTDAVSFSDGDPFAICARHEEARLACLSYMTLVLLDRNGGDYTKTARVTASMSGPEQNEVVKALSYKKAVEMVGSKHIEEESLWCNLFGSAHRQICIEGYLRGLVGYGLPGYEDRQTTKFCTSKLLSEEEQSICMSESLHIISLIR